MSDFAISAGRKLFEKNLAQYAPADPLYETYVDKKGKERRRKREIPPGLSERDAKILKSVNRRAHYLDKGFNLCGMRFGWTFIIGIIPGAGDIADITLNYVLVVRKARKADIPEWLLAKMLLNNAVSAAVGLVPIVGDVVLAAFKANSRNAALLNEFLRIRGEEFLKQEHERVENPANVRPGAGRAPGEHVPGKDNHNHETTVGQNTTNGGWFRKRTKGKTTPLTNDKGDVQTAQRQSRFVEDMPAETSMKR